MSARAYLTGAVTAEVTATLCLKARLCTRGSTTS